MAETVAILFHTWLCKALQKMQVREILRIKDEEWDTYYASRESKAALASGARATASSISDGSNRSWQILVSQRTFWGKLQGKLHPSGDVGISNVEGGERWSYAGILGSSGSR